MASISKERLREMEEEMDRFEAEIQTPGQSQGSGFILGANTFNQVQAALTTLRRQADDVGISRNRPDDERQQEQRQPAQPPPEREKLEDIDGDNLYGDEDLRFTKWSSQKPSGNDDESRSFRRKPESQDSRKFEDDEKTNEFFDVDERPGRAHGPRLAPPPPPPPPPPPGVTPSQSADNRNAHVSNVLAPPPPPPPPDTMNAAVQPPPAFMPPQLRHRMPLRPPPGYRPPLSRPLGMRPPPPPPPHQGPFGRPPGPPFMGGPDTRPGMCGPPGPHHMGHPGMGPPGMHHPPMGPPMGMGPGMGIGPQGMPQEMGMHPGMGGEVEKPQEVISSQPKIYSAAPVIKVELKKDETKKKKKKKKNKEGETTSAKESAPADNATVPDMEMAPGGGGGGGVSGPMYGGGGGFMGGMMQQGGPPPQQQQQQQHQQQMGPMHGMMGVQHGMSQQHQQQQQHAMMMQQMNMAGGVDGAANAASALAMMPGVAGGAAGKKKKKDKKFIRLAANTTWEDPTLSEWANDDYRIFAGDLGNEVTDDTLVRAFSKYPGFLKAKVIRDRRSDKTKGYGFISFKDPVDFARAMREMNGKYVGNRPIKLRKSNWKDRNIEVVKKKDKEKKRLGLK